MVATSPATSMLDQGKGIIDYGDGRQMVILVADQWKMLAVMVV